MIIVKLMGGVGNQLFQYSLAKSIEVLLGEVVKLDASELFGNGGASFRLDQFNISLELATPVEVGRFVGKGVRGRIARKFALNGFYRERERTVFDPTVFDRGERYYWGYWQSEQYFSSNRALLLEELSPKFEPSSAFIRYSGNMEVAACPVSIHVRRGDYLSVSDIGVLSMDYYREAVKLVREQTAGDAEFFIFSNDINWCKEQFDWLDGATFVEGAGSELEDLFLMSACTHNIIANSSFSWWAAWLNNSQDKMVVCPRKWMAVNPKGYKWTPAEWYEV